MRDFRDAKAMALTLREALNAKSVAITHSEALELIAKILGCRDWNALAARIQFSNGETASPAAPLPPDTTPATQPARQKVALDTAILDDCAGFYQLEDSAVFTVTREGDHLLTRLTGQGSMPVYPQSPTEFFADVIDAQITFVVGERGPAKSLILHQRGVSLELPRIDAATAQRITSRTEDKVKSQSANPDAEAALRRLIDGISNGKPNYDEMSTVLPKLPVSNCQTCSPGLPSCARSSPSDFSGSGPRGRTSTA
jgi:hypothetical protein